MNWQRVEAHAIPTLRWTSTDTHCLWWSFSWQRLKSAVIYCCFCTRRHAQRKRVMLEHWGDQWNTGKRPPLFSYIVLDCSSLSKILSPQVPPGFCSFFRRHSQHFWACWVCCSLSHQWRMRRFPSMRCCWFCPHRIEATVATATHVPQAQKVPRAVMQTI